LNFAFPALPEASNVAARNIAIGVLSAIVGLFLVILIVIGVRLVVQRRRFHRMGFDRLSSLTGAPGFSFSTLVESSATADAPPSAKTNTQVWSTLQDPPGGAKY
jgi:hypothetical protein